MEFRIADIFQDADVLKTASEAAAILREDNGKLLDSQEYSGGSGKTGSVFKISDRGHQPVRKEMRCAMQPIVVMEGIRKYYRMGKSPFRQLTAST